MMTRLLFAIAACAFLAAGCGSDSTSPGGQATQVDTVLVTPDTATIRIGGTTTLTAAAKNSAGITVSAGAPLWSSDNASVATVNSGGVVTGTAPGQATISATIAGVSGSAKIRVTASARSASAVPRSASP